MTAWRAAIRSILVALLLSLSAAGEAAQAAQPIAAGRLADPDGREILVMLKLSPDHFRPNAAYGGQYDDQLASNIRRRFAEHLAHKYGLIFVGEGWAMPLLSVDCYVMRVPAVDTVDLAIARISRDPLVAWSEPLHLYQTKASEAELNDPLFLAQPAAQAWRLADLHRVATGRGVTVAVVDSKIDVTHPDLAGQFAADRDFTSGRPDAPERHGTEVAGVIAAKQGNGVGIVGIAPEAKLMALRACWQSGDGSASAPTLCDSLSLAKAIQFAIEHGAQIVNLSLTGPTDRLLGQLIDIAVTRNISVVAAYDSGSPNGGFPASQPGVIAVSDDSLPSIPPGVYGAPGRDVPTTTPGGTWNLANGSSFAAAHVSGLLALVREGHSSSPRSMLAASRSDGGEVNACETLLRASKNCRCNCLVAAELVPARQ